MVNLQNINSASKLLNCEFKFGSCAFRVRMCFSVPEILQKFSQGTSLTVIEVCTSSRETSVLLSNMAKYSIMIEHSQAQATEIM